MPKVDDENAFAGVGDFHSVGTGSLLSPTASQGVGDISDNSSLGTSSSSSGNSYESAREFQLAEDAGDKSGDDTDGDKPNDDNNFREEPLLHPPRRTPFPLF